MNGEHTASKLGLLGSLYLSQGLPFGFFTQALPIMLRKQGFSLGEIGLTSLLALPWALKFLWAPPVDRYHLPGIGRRKSWIVALQLVGISLLVFLGTSSEMHSMTMMMGALLLLNLVAATQDIATDGFAVDLLSPPERGLANGIQVAGYRVGMIVGGGILLILYEQLGSGRTFLAMAAITGLATIPILVTREPSNLVAKAAPSTSSIHFFKHPGAWQLIGLIVTYKAGEAFATGMLRPFLADAGLSLENIGWLLGTVGFLAGLLGALTGGALVNRLGRRNALVLFGLLQAATVAGYAVLAISKPEPLTLYALCAAEHFAGGMATAALFTCMMDWCSRETAATDYTVQASAVVIATGSASAIAGFSAQFLGYFGHFALATVLALSAVVLVRIFFPTPSQAERLPCVAPEPTSCV